MDEWIRISRKLHEYTDMQTCVATDLSHSLIVLIYSFMKINTQLDTGDDATSRWMYMHMYVEEVHVTKLRSG